MHNINKVYNDLAYHVAQIGGLMTMCMDAVFFSSHSPFFSRALTRKIYLPGSMFSEGYLLFSFGIIPRSVQSLHLVGILN